MRQGHEYSLYTESPAGRTRLYGLLGIVSVLIVSGLRDAVVRYLITPGAPVPAWVFYVGAATPLVVFALLVLAFDRFLWHSRLTRPLYAIAQDTPPPHIAGTYTGKVTWRDKVGNVPRESRLQATIIQRWQRLVVAFEFFDSEGRPRAESNSEMAFIRQGMDSRRPTVHYTYAYEGTETADDGGIVRHMIHGTSVMDFSRNEGKWRVTGRYYSDDGGSGHIYLEQT